MSVQYDPGQFVWRELCTTDVPAATRFYSELFNWRVEKSPMPDIDYWLCYAGDVQVAGLMAAPAEVPQPFWSASVSVPDVDASAAAASERGAQLLVAPMDIPGIGRYAMLSDPQGAVLGLYKSNAGDAPVTQGVGQFCWEQLAAADGDAARDFYAAVVGWGTRPFGAGGDTTTQVFTLGDRSMASLTPLPPGAPPHWLSYVLVDDLARAHACITRFGGKVLMERWEVPTVGFISVITDPQGATLGLLEAPRPSA